MNFPLYELHKDVINGVCEEQMEWEETPSQFRI